MHMPMVFVWWFTTATKSPGGMKRGVQVAYWRAEEPYTLLTSIRDAMESDIAKIDVFLKYTR